VTWQVPASDDLRSTWTHWTNLLLILANTRFLILANRGFLSGRTGGRCAEGPRLSWPEYARRGRDRRARRGARAAGQSDRVLPGARTHVRLSEAADTERWVGVVHGLIDTADGGSRSQTDTRCLALYVPRGPRMPAPAMRGVRPLPSPRSRARQTRPPK
jgi:hypothetical protein